MSKRSRPPMAAIDSSVCATKRKQWHVLVQPGWFLIIRIAIQGIEDHHADTWQKTLPLKAKEHFICDFAMQRIARAGDSPTSAL